MNNKRTEQKDPNIIKIWEEIAKRKGHTTIQWTPAHCQVIGNELADVAAKEASKMNQKEAMVAFPDIQSLIIRKVTSPPLTHERLKKVYTGKVPHQDETKMSKKERFIIRALRTGHYTGLGAYRHRLDQTESDNCTKCGEPDESSVHILNCPATANIRNKFFDCLQVEISVLTEDPARAIAFLRRVYPEWFA